MPPTSDAVRTPEGFRRQLLEAGLLVGTAVDGLYGRSAAFEAIVAGITGVVTRAGADQQATVLRFPPVMPRDTFERSDYLRSFPQLTGSVHTFNGDDRTHRELLSLLESGGDWSEVLEPASVVLAPAACHPLYPLCTGRLPDGGRRFDVLGHCFRHEPAVDPARMQAFRMYEYVYVGDPASADAHCETWMARSPELLAGLGLEVEVVVANDPFFGRVGRMLGANQRNEALKFEVVAPINEGEARTAIASVNSHRDHFGSTFGIETSDGAVAHSACVGFGLERIALALLAAHGLDVGLWPSAVLDRLQP